MVAPDHPRLCSDSHEARSRGGLDPGKSLTRTTRGWAGRPLLTHLLTDKAFNATTSTYVATTPPAWEQCQRLILLFTAHPGMDGKRMPLYTSRGALFYLRRPLEAQYDDHYVPGFMGFGLIRSLTTPVAMSRSGLEHRRSTKEQRPHVDYRGSHAPHRTRVFHHPIVDITATP
jgi:hypothetical protein